MIGKNKIAGILADRDSIRSLTSKLARFAAAGLAALLAISGQPQVARAGLLYGTQGSSILAINPVTGAETTFASGLASLNSLAVDSSGNVYAGVDGVIEKFTPGGVGSVFASVSFRGNGLTFDASGNLYAVTQTPSIDRITPAGVVTTYVAAANIIDGNEAGGMAFDRSGNLFLTAGVRVEEFSPGGAASTFYTSSHRTSGMAIDSSGNIYVGVGGDSSGPTGSILEITPGGVVSTFASGLYGISGLAFDSSNNLYVADGYSASDGDPGTLLKFTPGGVESILVGNPSSPIGSIAYSPQTVPEPASLVMLGMGAVGILGYLRRRSNQANR